MEDRIVWHNLLRDTVIKFRLVNPYGGYTDQKENDEVNEARARAIVRILKPHPVVIKALKDHAPLDWHLLALEMPSISQVDGVRVAYFRNEAQQEGFKLSQSHSHQTVTTAQRYLTRHFPNLKDHEIRNLADSMSSYEYKILYDMEEMLEALRQGPNSCMADRGERGEWDFHDSDIHPYEAYDPEYGWGLSIALQDGKIISRGLVNKESMTVVRTFGQPDSNGYSQPCGKHEAWLKEQGFKKTSEWKEGLKLRRIWVYGENCPYLPYIDGCNQTVADHKTYLTIDDDGEWEATNTNGIPDSKEENTRECDRCEDRVDEDDLTYVEYTDQSVCECCISNDFTDARTVRRSSSYGSGGYGSSRWLTEIIPDEDAVFVNDIAIHPDYLDENEVVTLENGDYAFLEDTEMFEDEYYLTDDICAEDERNSFSILVRIEDELYCIEDGLVEWDGSRWVVLADKDDEEEEVEPATQDMFPETLEPPPAVVHIEPFTVPTQGLYDKYLASVQGYEAMKGKWHEGYIKATRDVALAQARKELQDAITAYRNYGGCQALSDLYGAHYAATSVSELALIQEQGHEWLWNRIVDAEMEKVSALLVGADSASTEAEAEDREIVDAPVYGLDSYAAYKAKIANLEYYQQHDTTKWTDALKEAVTADARRLLKQAIASYRMHGQIPELGSLWSEKRFDQGCIHMWYASESLDFASFVWERIVEDEMAKVDALFHPSVEPSLV